MTTVQTFWSFYYKPIMIICWRKVYISNIHTFFRLWLQLLAPKDQCLVKLSACYITYSMISDKLAIIWALSDFIFCNISVVLCNASLYELYIQIFICLHICISSRSCTHIMYSREFSRTINFSVFTASLKINSLKS